MTPFQNAMQFVALHEWANKEDGQYTNNPVDPGGETKYGISKRAHPDVDVKNLSLADALAIYERDYWLKYGLNLLASPYCIAMMDSTVNNGYKIASVFDRQADGDYKKFIQLRRQFYLDIITRHPEEIKFKNGWMNRMNDLSKYCDIIAQTPT